MNMGNSVLRVNINKSLLPAFLCNCAYAARSFVHAKHITRDLPVSISIEFIIISLYPGHLAGVASKIVTTAVLFLAMYIFVSNAIVVTKWRDSYMTYTK
jgi:hypothetical protein